MYKRAKALQTNRRKKRRLAANTENNDNVLRANSRMNKILDLVLSVTKCIMQMLPCLIRHDS
ncbi:hypothetical protein DVR12_21125 [Chitinophaga silvatica]|uniref:Uncharacterized protein n=1 Tax=Chitinophaga silvatica TaxID=2282649 RepID=A0A3E1Y653_9BACT|nr:hypothetical protein DVR12_21125 [Chitinophaga silvatica]